MLNRRQLLTTLAAMTALAPWLGARAASKPQFPADASSQRADASTGSTENFLCIGRTALSTHGKRA